METIALNCTLIGYLTTGDSKSSPVPCLISMIGSGTSSKGGKLACGDVELGVAFYIYIERH